MTTKERTDARTITVKTLEGPLQIPVKRTIALCGMEGFAVHRPVAFDCKGTNPHGWIVSHFETGLKALQYPARTIKEARGRG